jgi:fructan beta-fructosidase
MPLNVNVSFPTDTDLDASAVVFRDPKLMYHAASGAWIAVISGGDHMQFHRSTDLIHWSLVSRFGYTHGSHAGIWECPDLFEFSTMNSKDQTQRWFLIVSIDRNAVAGGSGIQYFIGTFDGYTFENLQPPQNINWLDYGPDFYAGITYYNVPRYDNRRVMIAWMNNWQYAQDVPTGPLWRGQMAIPRQLELEYNPFRNAYQLRQSPVYELYGHSTKLLTFQGQSLNSCSSNVLSEVSAQSFMLSTEFREVTRRTAIHFRLRQSSDGTEYTQVSYIGETNRIELDRSHSGNVNFHPLFRTHYNMTLDDQTIATGVLQLQIIVDRCSVEVFVNRGKSTMTALIFPRLESHRMELAMEGDEEIQMDYLEVMLL